MNDVGRRAERRARRVCRGPRCSFVQGANPAATAMDQGCFVARARARRPVHRRARPGAHRHGRLRRRRAAGHDPLRGRRPRRLVRLVQHAPRASRSSIGSARAAPTTRWRPRFAGRARPAGRTSSTPTRSGWRRSSARTAASQSLPTTRARRAPRCSSSTRFPAGDRQARAVADPDRASCRLPRYARRDSASGLAMLSPSTNRTINSMFAEFDPPDIAVSINPADAAAARMIVDGARVRVFNELGADRARRRGRRRRCVPESCRSPRACGAALRQRTHAEHADPSGSERPGCRRVLQ